MADYQNLAGTTESTFQIGSTGPMLKSTGGIIEARDASDSAYVVVRTGDGTGSNDAVSRGAHEVLDSLVHDLAETSYEEVTRTSGLVTSVIVWTDSGKTQKVRELTITRSGGRVSVFVRKQYDGTGGLVQTVTSTITRSGGRVASIDHVET